MSTKIGGTSDDEEIIGTSRWFHLTPVNNVVEADLSIKNVPPKLWSEFESKTVL